MTLLLRTQAEQAFAPRPKFYVKKGDTLPVIAATLENSDGSHVDLQAATVTFTMRPAGGGTVKVSETATIVSGDAPEDTVSIVSYAWQAADTDTQGDFIGEFEVEIGGAKQTFPTAGYIEIFILENLADP